jgi:hypothetical protein
VRAGFLGLLVGSCVSLGLSLGLLGLGALASPWI